MDNATPIYLASSGPGLDPIRHIETPSMLDVIAEEDPAALLGQAQLVGWMFEGLRPIATYRLVVGGLELPGLFNCVGRRFHPVEKEKRGRR
jgi:hypothetical protein